MDVHKSYEKLKGSKEFVDFLEKEEGFSLVHAYLMKEYGKEANWEFGFYHEGRDKMVVFETNPPKRTPEQDVFKKEGVVNKISLEDVEISLDSAMEKCEELRKEKFNSEPVTKYIAILQHLHKQLWNITLITKAFNLINIKIDTKTGDVLSSSKSSMMDLGIRQA